MNIYQELTGMLMLAFVIFTGSQDFRQKQKHAFIERKCSSLEVKRPGILP